MSAAITKYYNALSDLEALKAEIAKMEESKALKEELEFKAALEKLMDDYSKDAKEVAKIIGGFTAPSGRSKRTPSKWVNPHTKEEVVTAGGNHKTLKEWREKWGADEVASWKQPA